MPDVLRVDFHGGPLDSMSLEMSGGTAAPGSLVVASTDPPFTYRLTSVYNDGRRLLAGYRPAPDATDHQ